MSIKNISEPHYEQVFGPTMAHQTIQGIDYALARFKALGASVPSGSRIYRARTAIAGAVTGERLRRSWRTRRLLTEAHRTALEFYAIARSLNPRAVPVPKSVKRKFALAFGGADDPADDSERTVVARNTQFELWVGAWFTAGRKPTRFAEPDLQIGYGDEWYGVAAKRVRSRRQIGKRVRDAADQVAKRTGTGFIALALDNYSLTRRIRSRTELAAGARFFASYPEIDDAARYLMSSAPHIRGLLCFGQVARWLPEAEPPSLSMTNLTRTYLLPSDATDAERLTTYFKDHAPAFRDSWRHM